MSFNAPKLANRLLAAALAVVLSGCATVSGGWRPQRTTLTSDPPAAAVTAEGEAVGETPVTVPFRQRGPGRRSVVLRFDKEGFAASEFQVEPRLNRWIFGNLALAALSGAVAAVDRSDVHPGLVSAGTLLWSVGIDFLSGAAFTLPRSVDTSLTPSPAGASRRIPPPTLEAPVARVSSFAPKHLMLPADTPTSAQPAEHQSQQEDERGGQRQERRQRYGECIGCKPIQKENCGECPACK